MHRSGTSCLAGCLEDLGLTLGPVNTRAPHNVKGNRENPRFWPIHDAVLARVGAAWDRPPTEPVVWTAGEIFALRRVIDEDYADLPRPWGFKDPRATLLLDGWFEVFPDLRLVASIRHPAAVAGSLKARNRFDTDRSLAIWAEYNEAVLTWRDRVTFSVIDYDDRRYEARVRAVAGDFGLDAAAPMPFRSQDLNHQAPQGEVPADTQAMWDRLKALTA